MIKGTSYKPQLTQVRHDSMKKQGTPIQSKVKVKGRTSEAKQTKLDNRDSAVKGRTLRNTNSKNPFVKTGNQGKLNSEFNGHQIMKIKATIDTINPSDIEAKAYDIEKTGMEKTKGVLSSIWSGLKTVGKGLTQAITFIPRIAISQILVRPIGAAVVGIAKLCGHDMENSAWKQFPLHTKGEADFISKINVIPFKESRKLFGIAEGIKKEVRAMNQNLKLHDRDVIAQQSKVDDANHALDTYKRTTAVHDPQVISNLEFKLKAAKSLLGQAESDRQKFNDRISEKKMAIAEITTLAEKVRGGDSLEKILYVSSMMKTGANTANVIAFSSEAAQSGSSFDSIIKGATEITTGKGDPMISTATLGALGIAGGALAVGSEAFDMYQTGKKLMGGLDRRAKVEQMLKFDSMDQGEQYEDLKAEKQKLTDMKADLGPKLDNITAQISKLDDEIAVLRADGTKSKALKKAMSKRYDLFVKKAKMETQLKSQENVVGMKNRILAQGLKPKERAVLQQINNRVDKKFKIAKMIRNVVGMAAGGIAIAVGVAALAGLTLAVAVTPVGWALAGTAFVAAVGFAIHSAVTQSNRQGKSDTCDQNDVNIDSKVEELQKTKEELSHDIEMGKIRLESLMAQPEDNPDKVKYINSELPVLEGQIKLDSAMSKLRAIDDGTDTVTRRIDVVREITDIQYDLTVAKSKFEDVKNELNVNISLMETAGEELDTAIEILGDMKKQNHLQRLAVNPDAAIETLANGIEDGDKLLTYIGEEILGMKFQKNEHANQVMLDRVKKSISMNPSL